LIPGKGRGRKAAGSGQEGSIFAIIAHVVMPQRAYEAMVISFDTDVDLVGPICYVDRRAFRGTGPSRKSADFGRG